MHHFLLKGGSKSGVAEDKMELLKKRIDIADKALQTVDSIVQFWFCNVEINEKELEKKFFYSRNSKWDIF